LIGKIRSVEGELGCGDRCFEEDTAVSTAFADMIDSMF